MKKRKTTELFCQHCGRKYTAERCDSKYCSHACRTAAYRKRQQEKEKHRSLHTYYPRESFRIRQIREQLIAHLKAVLDLERQYQVPMSLVKSVYDRLHATTQAWIALKAKPLQEQVEWIWTYVEGFLYMQISDSEKSNVEVCSVRLTSEVRSGIEKLIG